MISANGLSTSLGGQRVVTDLSVELGEGEMVALVGPNGAGKSSALKALAGVTPLAAGEILIDPTRLRPRRRGSSTPASSTTSSCR